MHGWGRRQGGRGGAWLMTPRCLAPPKVPPLAFPPAPITTAQGARQPPRSHHSFFPLLLPLLGRSTRRALAGWLGVLAAGRAMVGGRLAAGALPALLPAAAPRPGAVVLRRSLLSRGCWCIVAAASPLHRSGA